MDKLKEKVKKKEPEASKQQKKPNIQRPPVKKLNLDRPYRPKPTRDDSSVSSDESFHSDVSSVMDFMPSTKVPVNEDAELVQFSLLCNKYYSQLNTSLSSKVTEAAVNQMKKLWHVTNIYMYPHIQEYAEKLTSYFPGDLKVCFFCNSGSEANDLAVLMARLYTNAFDVISLRNAYHGCTPHTQGLTALPAWKYPLPQGFGILHAMNPDPYRGKWGGSHCRDSPVQTQKKCDCKPGICKASDLYAEQLQEVLQYSLPQKKVAGFFAESIQGVGGAVQFTKNYLKKAFELVREQGGLCISDEVQTGFGRTGKHFWGFQAHDVMPDIVTLAKGVGNGYPLAAVVTTPKIAKSLTERLFFNTFGGNPVASAVGSAVLDVLEEEKLMENSDQVGTYLLEQLSSLRNEFEIVGDVRGKGLMIGVELVSDKQSQNPLPASRVLDIMDDCKNMGLLFGKGGYKGHVFRIKPPMCITKEDADFCVSVLRLALRNHTEKQAS
ncbi:alanine--glyoxylate aminotransferase 2, mitochondrial-like [Centruroides sculpturatus]|uniref:alanine--glyoxylate aminotransferase 2, mitochondrial-like n=1 Tax=Centruroides sculpturatus TaxID=218467 RepID=UPI000C6E7E50|nr:alanine--glyoxylate aminotransferase 2, mitochondrial-like [Centruroides sculpturatus]